MASCRRGHRVIVPIVSSRRGVHLLEERASNGHDICGRCNRHAVSSPDIGRETFVDPAKDNLRDPGWIPSYIATHLG